MKSIFSMFAALLLSLFTSAQFALLKDIFEGGEFSYPTEFTEYNGAIYFSAAAESISPEVWVTDGTTVGTEIFFDLAGSLASHPYSFTVFNDELYFVAYYQDGNYDAALWKTDGTVGNTVMVKSFPESSNGISSMRVLNDELIFFLEHTGNANYFPYELWKSDGTTDGTVLIKNDYDYVSEESLGQMQKHVIVNGELYFSAKDQDGFGYELWKTDGTLEGTLRMSDINPNDGNAEVSWLTLLGNTVFFSANDGVHETELWTHDTATEMNAMVMDINPNGYAYPSYLCASDNAILFSANDEITGSELWISDGTPEGTMLVKDINPGMGKGPESGLPAYIVWDGTQWIFSANTQNQGNELMKSNGTEAGTVLVKDIYAGNQGSNPQSLFLYNGLVYFTAEDVDHGIELWYSNGSESQTLLIADIEIGVVSSSPADMLATSQGIYLSAVTVALGREPYRIDLPTAIAEVRINENVLSIYPNPSFENATISGLEMNEEFFIKDVAGRTLLQQKALGKTQLINVEKLDAGVYFISSATNENTVTMIVR